MRAVLQRVSSAAVRVGGEPISRIGPGLLVLLGVAGEDEDEDARFIAGKIADLRLFSDSGGFDLSVGDAGGAVLVVSQFTLYGNIRKGRRPSFGDAAAPPEAKRLYELVIEELAASGLIVRQGVFQAKMEVEMVNDGPVTLIVESKQVSR